MRKKINIDPFVSEGILAVAVGLNASGRMRNEIYFGENRMYIANFDNTVLLQFILPSKYNFEKMGFTAADYDGPDFAVDGESVIFFLDAVKTTGFVREKVVPMLNRKFDDVEELFLRYDAMDFEGANVLNLKSEATELLDESLSHVEISAINRLLLILQRDIYSGSKIKLVEGKRGAGRLGIDSPFVPKSDFGPMGIRTPDIFAVFSIFDRIKFLFKGNKFCKISAQRNIGSDLVMMSGIIAGCTYDEMITIEPAIVEEGEIELSVTEKCNNNGEEESDEFTLDVDQVFRTIGEQEKRINAEIESEQLTKVEEKVNTNTVSRRRTSRRLFNNL